jgi:hypothetical protein
MFYLSLNDINIVLVISFVVVLVCVGMKEEELGIAPSVSVPHS